MKNNWKKKCISIILCALIISSYTLPKEVKAEENQYVNYWEEDDDTTDFFKLKDGIVYCIYKKQVTIREILSDEPEVRIPEDMDGYPVTEIDCGVVPETLKTLYVPKTVKAIALSAINEKTSLKKIIVDKDNKKFSSKNGVVYNKKQTELVLCPFALESFHIPKSVKTIKKMAFASTCLKEIVIPDTVKNIEEYAFYMSDRLKKVKLPNRLKRIEQYTFCWCTKLKEITIPVRIEQISDCAFLLCYNLKKVKFEEGSRLRYIGGFGGCSSLERIQLPDTVEVIEDGAFTDCIKLRKIELSENICGMGDYAFAGCENLKEVSIPSKICGLYGTFDNCKNLRKVTFRSNSNLKEFSGFKNCKELKSITIPKSVTIIYDSAFQGCTSLKTIVIPENAKEIWKYAFKGCKNLKKITVKSKKVKYLQEGIFDNIDNKDKITFKAPKGSKIYKYAKKQGFKMKEF